jgi:hypothetical protein
LASLLLQLFDDKRDENGRITKFKARFVAMGFTQKKGIDFSETFAGVVVGKSFRTMLVILNENKSFEMEHWDVKMAFTQVELKEDIFMYQPELYENKVDDCVCKLEKSLYGLKQAAKNWGDFLRDFLVISNFFSLHADPCVYVSKKDEAWCVVSTHVDDISLFCSMKKEKNFETIYSKKFLQKWKLKI